MSDNDVLVDLLGLPEITKMSRRPEGVAGRVNGDSDHDGGYDLTNPNLHHGVEDIYRPFQSSEQLESTRLPEPDAPAEASGKTVDAKTAESLPAAIAIANQTADEEPRLSFGVSSYFAASGADNAITVLGSTPAGLVIDAPTEIMSGMPADGDAGSNTVTVADGVTVDDTRGVAVTATVHVEVEDSGPTATAIANQTAYEGQAYSLDVSSHFVAPAAGDTLTFSGPMPAGLQIDAHTGVISGVPTDGDYGSNTITVTATDAHGMAVSATFQLQVGDSGPTATTIANQTAYEGQAYSLDVSSHFVAPAAGDTLTFSGSIPAGLQIDAHTGVISGVPTDSDYGSNPITVTATDAHGMAVSTTFQLQVGDSGPTATTIANQSAYEGQAFSLDVSSHFVAPAAGDALTFSGSMPAGLQIDAHTGMISGVPTDSDFTSSAHEYNFNFTSFDGRFTVTGQFTTSQSLDAAGGFDITGIAGSVVGPNGSVISGLINNPSHSTGSISPDGVWIYDNILYAGSNTLVDYGGVLFTSNNYEYNIFYDAGHYLLETLNPQGVLNPGEAGSFTISEVPADHPITVTATDAHGMAVSETFHLQVGDHGPTAIAIANQSTYVGQNFSLDVSSHFVAPAAGDTLTFSGSMPAGLSLDARTGVISGVPTQSDFGDNPITVTAIDAHGMTISETFHLQVNDHAPVITSNGAGDTASVYVAENSNAVTTVTAVDADSGSTLTYSIAGGADAAKFAVNATTGALSFGSTPDYEHPTDAGGNNVYDVVVQVSDGSLTDTQAIAVTVNDVAENIQLSNSGVIFVNSGVTELSITGGSNSDNITGGSGNNIISGGDGNDTITGGAANDILHGDKDNDTIYGGAGNDILQGGEGNDILVGGTGIDTADFSDATGNVTVSLNIAGPQNTTHSGNDSLSGIENLTGSNYNDTLTGDAGANVLSGGAGDDVLIGGGTGNMLVNGSFEADHIAAGSWAPSATLTGWTAASGDFETWNHLTVGGHSYTASDGVQSVELNSGMGLDSFYQDVQTASGAQYTLSLDAAMRADAPSSSGTIQVYWNGNLIDSFDPTSTSWSTHSYTVTGDGGSDRLMFSEVAADNDSLGGLIDNVRLVGNDTLDGGAGNDTLVGGQGNDTLIGGSGIDTADYSTVTAGVTISLGLTGGQNTVGAGTDTLSGIENLTGSHYNDTLTGDSNDNVITGGLGDDKLTGGSGSDTFIYHVGDGNDTVAGGAGSSWTDTIELHDGASTLGTYGVDWTVSITSGSIVSTDAAHHTITLSPDAGGHINLSNSAVVTFTELEHITW